MVSNIKSESHISWNKILFWVVCDKSDYNRPKLRFSNFMKNECMEYNWHYAVEIEIEVEVEIAYKKA